MLICRDGLAKLWDVGESKCLGDVLQAQGPINCCALAETSDEITVEHEREVTDAFHFFFFLFISFLRNDYRISLTSDNYDVGRR